MLILTPSWAAAGVIAAGARMAATASRVIAVRLIASSPSGGHPAPWGAALTHACRKYGISPCRRARRDHGIHAPIQPIFRHRPDTILNKRKRARLRGPAFGTQTPLATIVVVIVRIRDAVVIPVAIRSALATALVAIGDAVAVTVPAARDVAPLLAAAGSEALPGIRDVAGAHPERFPAARRPDVAVVDQAGVAGRPDIAGPRRRHRLIDSRRWRGAEDDADLRGGRRHRRHGHRRC